MRGKVRRGTVKLRGRPEGPVCPGNRSKKSKAKRQRLFLILSVL